MEPNIVTPLTKKHIFMTKLVGEPIDILYNDRHNVCDLLEECGIWHVIHRERFQYYCNYPIRVWYEDEDIKLFNIEFLEPTDFYSVGPHNGY